MGNCCCPEKENESVGKKPPRNKDKNDNQNVAQPVDFEMEFKEIYFIVKVGDITKETADALVSGTDNYVRNRSNSFLTPAMTDSLNKVVAEKRGAAAQEPLLNGEIILTGPGCLRNVQSVFHISVPLWRGGRHREMEILQQGFSKILEEANKNNITSIIFTDIAAQLFGIPKQITAQAMMKAIHEYATKYQGQSKIKTIKFVHKERQTVQLFEDFLRQEAGVRTEKVQSDYSDALQGSKLENEIQTNLKEPLLNQEQNNVDETKQSINPAESSD
ncbi:macro domain protein (macronuclear) [Tetrahymena thermophila SB210]|uniref:Macro domain protein n=1 Tax=Tetrahymena thermophila (strain SB210) TaxID=312017 RepID=Q22YW8_TETTS|nr:macro domain protein [Tetrahymena thermophila SB210]EAR90553.1 macro domain protein [Tetrahymena thermophila SB210]|eukprot:XP_001010798.1 macro domain protein [Tetrahymena thermophila SB210]